MKIDWVPYSASALVAGAVALAMGGLLMPSVGGTTDSLQIVQDHDGRWLGVAVLFFLAAVALTMGLPSVLSLLGRKGSRRGLLGTGIFVIACLGTAGYAMLLVFFRALVLSDSVNTGGLDSLTDDVGLGGFLTVWIASFYVGEALIAWGLWHAPDVPRWIPLALLGHVVSLPLASVLPEQLSSLLILTVVLGLCGIGITANQRAHH